MKPESKQTKPAVRSRLSMAMILGLLVVLAACGGSGDEAGGSEAVATIEGGDTDEQAVATEAEGEPGDGSSESTETGEATAEENALAFAACMRANGIDFADPTVDADLSLIHISEPTRRYAISYAVFCLKKIASKL